MSLILFRLHLKPQKRQQNHRSSARWGIHVAGQCTELVKQKVRNISSEIRKSILTKTKNSFGLTINSCLIQQLPVQKGRALVYPQQRRSESCRLRVSV